MTSPSKYMRVDLCFTVGSTRQLVALVDLLTSLVTEGFDYTKPPLDEDWYCEDTTCVCSETPQHPEPPAPDLPDGVQERTYTDVYSGYQQGRNERTTT